MKKLIRFILALIATPIMLVFLFLDWVYEKDYDYDWFYNIGIKKK